MKLAKWIVMGALLGTMTQTEVVEAVQLQSNTEAYSHIAHKAHKKSHKKHKK